MRGSRSSGCAAIGVRWFRRADVSLLLLVGVFGAAGPVLSAPKSSDDPASTRYVGAEVCQGCHEDPYQSFTLFAQKRMFERDEVAERRCEGCHGAGAEHVDGGGDPARIRSFAGASPHAIQEACTRGHEAKLSDGHAKVGLTCLTCHCAHHYRRAETILVMPLDQLCRNGHHSCCWRRPRPSLAACRFSPPEPRQERTEIAPRV